jgi:CheY-like chemotaxis protein
MARLLIADDDPQVRQLIVRVLQNAGHEVTEAGNGREAVQQFARTPADVVVLDMLMPEMDGLETIQRLRSVAPHVRIIAISGGGRIDSDEYLDWAKVLGADRTLQKPFPLADLVTMTQELLEK